MSNGIWRSLCLNLVNSNVIFQKVQWIGPVSRFTEFPPQSLVQCQMAFDNLLGVMMNGIWQSICLDLINNNVHAIFSHNIPKGARDRARFTF